MGSRRGNFRNKKFNQSFDRKPRLKKEYSSQDQLLETDVGITEYLSDLKGFSAVIKARFSDFQVNEISLDGSVAKLTNTGIPKDFEMKLTTCNFKEIIESPSNLIPQDKWESIKKLLEEDDGKTVIIEADHFDKEARTELHKCVKSHFGRKVVAATVEKDGKKFLEIKRFDKDQKVDSRTQWPKDKGEYVHFLLYKESLDTMDAILTISNCVKIQPSAFSYAGVKDRRAKSTQWCSVKKAEPWKLITKCNSQRNLKVGNLMFKDKPLMLGQLKGNRFRIALRNVLADDELIEESMKFIEENGFINYYGLQRFGNDKQVPTYDIGVALLLGQWKKACDLILKPKDAEDQTSEIVKAKKIYAETGDANKAFEVLPKHKYRTLEGRLLCGLKNSSANDYVCALEKIPRYTRLMYMNSFQSLIWNKVVSERIKRFGLKPVVGDLVYVENIQDVTEVSGMENTDEKAEDDDEKIKDANHDEELAPAICDIVKALEESDLSNYTINDIVLPLPGYGVQYPNHLKDCYKEAIECFGLTLEMTPQKVRMYSTRGNYRHIMQKIDNLSWKILLYNNPNDNLIRSDFEELKGNPEPESMDLGRYKALVMQFDLSSSCYATMVLREILKSNTSTSAQAKLNKYHDGKQKMISVEQVVNKANNVEESDTSHQSSLLSNPEKYAEFKNSIFKDILAPTKRKAQDDDTETKKMKLDNGKQ